MKRTKIIADIGANHMGDMDVAEKMIEVAANIGIDVVKFQSWQACKLNKSFPNYEEVYARYKKTELSDEDHFRLIRKCKECNIEFLTTCFDLDRVDFLASLEMEAIKIASSDCTSYGLLHRLGFHFSQMIVSTGMAVDWEIKEMIKHLTPEQDVVLHCVSVYPTPLDQINLKRMEWLRSLGVRVGFSDHSLGTEAGKLAISMGAEVLEKHFTLSRSLPGKDQHMSTEPHEFQELVEWADQVAWIQDATLAGMSYEEMELRKITIGKWGDNR